VNVNSSATGVPPGKGGVDAVVLERSVFGAAERADEARLELSTSSSLPLDVCPLQRAIAVLEDRGVEMLRADAVERLRVSLRRAERRRREDEK
jgi:hypothetical protein